VPPNDISNYIDDMLFILRRFTPTVTFTVVNADHRIPDDLLAAVGEWVWWAHGSNTIASLILTYPRNPPSLRARSLSMDEYAAEVGQEQFGIEMEYRVR
jgi:hypothetical protein